MEFVLYNEDKLPSWLEYPNEYFKLIENGLVSFLPWFLLNSDEVSKLLCGLKERYPEKELYPFAKRDDCDDIACWEKDKPGKVVLIHDFSSVGFETKKVYLTFWDWFREAIEQMIDFD